MPGPEESVVQYGVYLLLTGLVACGSAAEDRCRHTSSLASRDGIEIPPDQDARVGVNIVAPGYFAALGVPHRGQVIDGDRDGAPGRPRPDVAAAPLPLLGTATRREQEQAREGSSDSGSKAHSTQAFVTHNSPLS
jgi:hypothetical protein